MVVSSIYPNLLQDLDEFPGKADSSRRYNGHNMLRCRGKKNCCESGTFDKIEPEQHDRVGVRFTHTTTKYCPEQNNYAPVFNKATIADVDGGRNTNKA